MELPKRQGRCVDRMMVLIRSVASLLVVVSGPIFLIGISCAVSTKESECLDDNYPNFRVQFINERLGWIIGPHLLRTTDGGATWDTIRYKNCVDLIKARDGPESRKHYVQFVDQTWVGEKARLMLTQYNILRREDYLGVTL
jgi:photosystem II stability/assembly factor-like uncharacterized protein